MHIDAVGEKMFDPFQLLLEQVILCYGSSPQCESQRRPEFNTNFCGTCVDAIKISIFSFLFFSKFVLNLN